MCGISVIINKSNTSVDHLDIQKINDLIKHRGPDDEGFFEGPNFSFGHRRLSILGLGKEGHQPMHYNNEFTLTYNGEIYNYLELKEELKGLGHKLITSTDTEVILASYKEWGTECVSKFNGMWSFVLYDKKKNILFCSRDRFGIKPFYYLETPNNFIIGSEIKQLLPFLEKTEVNKAILLDFLITGYEEHTDSTFFKSIYKLPGGSNLTYNLSDHSKEMSPYYSIQINKDLSKLNEADSVNVYKQTLIDSVKLRLRSDVKVGACLSGGLDSSSISSLASSIHKLESSDKFNAIHAKSSELKTDESGFANQVSEHCDLDMHLIEPTIEDFQKNIDEVVSTQEEPFGSPSIFMQYFVMQKAKEINCTVMLDGQGGDETLLGYEKYYPAYLMSLKKSKMLREFINSSNNSRLSKKQLFQYFFYFTRYNIRKKRLKSRNSFIKPKYLANFECELLKKSCDSYLDIEKLQKIEINNIQLPHLLKFEDKNSMKNSIETRLPFLDYRVLETSLSIKHQFKINQGWTKYILRKAIEDKLQESVVWRKNKLGFNAPEASWMDSINDDMIKEINESEILNEIIDFTKLSFSKLDLRTKWKLYNVAKWEKTFHVSIEN